MRADSRGEMGYAKASGGFVSTCREDEVAE